MDKNWWLRNRKEIHGKEEGVEHEHEDGLKHSHVDGDLPHEHDTEDAVEEKAFCGTKDEVEDIVEDVVEKPTPHHGKQRNSGMEWYNAKKGLWVHTNNGEPCVNQ